MPFVESGRVKQHLPSCTPWLIPEAAIATGLCKSLYGHSDYPLQSIHCWMLPAYGMDLLVGCTSCTSTNTHMSR